MLELEEAVLEIITSTPQLDGELFRRFEAVMKMKTQACGKTDGSASANERRQGRYEAKSLVLSNSARRPAEQRNGTCLPVCRKEVSTRD